MDKRFVILGSILGFIGVAAGAFGAHALRDHFVRFPDLKSPYETAVDYNFYHALALLFVGWASSHWPTRWVVWSGYLFLIGVIIFSGSLYLLAITGIRWLGAITPLGGVAFLAAWVCLGWGVARNR
jgi:uncharacterized membrane protein YgdD (TMEM256/DUF423 family)